MKIAIIVYLLVVAGLSLGGHRYFNQRWAKRERARTTVGVVIVFGPALAMALLGYIDIVTVIVLFAGFGAAGAVAVYRDIQNQTSGVNDLRNQILDDNQTVL